MRFISRIRSLVRDLVRDEKVSLNFGDRHPNAHILAIEPESIEKQIEKLDQVVFEAPTYEQFGPVRMRTNPLNCCCYPTRTHLHGIVDPSNYAGRPYTFLLAQGEPARLFESDSALLNAKNAAM